MLTSHVNMLRFSTSPLREVDIHKLKEVQREILDAFNQERDLNAQFRRKPDEWEKWLSQYLDETENPDKLRLERNVAKERVKQLEIEKSEMARDLHLVIGVIALVFGAILLVIGIGCIGLRYKMKTSVSDDTDRSSLGNGARISKGKRAATIIPSLRGEGVLTSNVTNQFGMKEILDMTPGEGKDWCESQSHWRQQEPT